MQTLLNSNCYPGELIQFVDKAIIACVFLAKTMNILNRFCCQSTPIEVIFTKIAITGFKVSIRV